MTHGSLGIHCDCSQRWSRERVRQDSGIDDKQAVVYATVGRVRVKNLTQVVDDTRFDRVAHRRTAQWMWGLNFASAKELGSRVGDELSAHVLGFFFHLLVHV